MIEQRQHARVQSAASSPSRRGEVGPQFSRRLAVHCAQFLDRHKLEDIAVFEVGPSMGITDYFVVATGRNSRHLRAASDKLLKELRDQSVERRSVEGYKDDKWVLVDLDEAVVHLFGAEARRYYDLELLWGDCPRVEWEDERGMASDEAPGDHLVDGPSSELARRDPGDLPSRDRFGAE